LVARSFGGGQKRPDGHSSSKPRRRAACSPISGGTALVGPELEHVLRARPTAAPVRGKKARSFEGRGRANRTVGFGVVAVVHDDDRPRGSSLPGREWRGSERPRRDRPGSDGRSDAAAGDRRGAGVRKHVEALVNGASSRPPEPAAPVAKRNDRGTVVGGRCLRPQRLPGRPRPGRFAGARTGRVCESIRPSQPQTAPSERSGAGSRWTGPAVSDPSPTSGSGRFRRRAPRDSGAGAAPSHLGAKRAASVPSRRAEDRQWQGRSRVQVSACVETTRSCGAKHRGEQVHSSNVLPGYEPVISRTTFARGLLRAGARASEPSRQRRGFIGRR